MPSKPKKLFNPDDRWVLDILEAKISPKNKLRRMTQLAQRLEDDLSRVLTDKDYAGGVQYWIAAHDKLVLRLVNAYSALVKYQVCVLALYAALDKPKLRPQAVALFKKLNIRKKSHARNTDNGPQGRRVPDQKPARTSPRRSKAV